MCILCVHSLDKLMRDLEEDFFANHKRRGLELVKAQQDKMDAWHASDEYKAERYRFKELFKKNDI